MTAEEIIKAFNSKYPDKIVVRIGDVDHKAAIITAVKDVNTREMDPFWVIEYSTKTILPFSVGNSFEAFQKSRKNVLYEYSM